MHHLYLHIPFCPRRCSYCDFNTYANLEDRIETYVEALCAELTMLATTFPPVSQSIVRANPLAPTIFLGGGTPSMLTLEQLEHILTIAGKLIPLKQAEITLEANPGAILGATTPALDYLRGLRTLGINRLSMGVQSLHDPTLRILGRIHTAAEARACFETARRAGFDNINLDFMFGLPGQSLSQWQDTLTNITTWGADHFSLYSLILEERTPLYPQVQGGRVALPDNDSVAAMYEAAMEHFAAAGYTQYEISNWARNDHASSHPTATLAAADNSHLHPTIPTYACQHNLAYWFNYDYLAAGAGAHGHIYPQRYVNLLQVDDYIAAIRIGKRPIAETTTLTPNDRAAETMFMGLRLNIGVSLAHFRTHCDIELDVMYHGTLKELVAQGLVEHDSHSVRLTPRGRMLGNQVFTHFV